MQEQELHDLLIRIGVQNVVRRGNNLMGCCPSGNHADRRPSWGIRVDSPHPHGCFSCGFRGKTLYSLLVTAGNMSPREARILTGETEAQVDTSKLTLLRDKKETKEIDEESLFPYYSSKRSDTYFKLRGLSLETIRELSLMYDRRENRVLYPWYIDGKLVAVTGRTLNANVTRMGAKIRSYFEGMDKRSLLYLPARKIDRSPLILVEGEFDAAKVYEAGFSNVAALGHAKFSDGQKNLTLNSAATEVWVFTDDDKAGWAAYNIIEKKLKNLRMVKRISYDPIRANYQHLLSRGAKLDPGVLEPADIREVLMASSRQLSSLWSQVKLAGS